MILKNINPTSTKAWSALQEHYNKIKEVKMQEMFKENSNRKSDFTLKFEDFTLDFSKNRIDLKTFDLLINLAKKTGLKEAIEAQFSGEKINITENRAVLHTALRDKSETPIRVDGKNIKIEIKETLEKIKDFSDGIIGGKLKGFTNKPFTDVVNIGIGGSDLGPKMAVEALKFYQNNLRCHFISNVDGDHVFETIKGLNRETTLFVIVSKTFTTQETLTNALTVKKWFLDQATEADIAHNFVAVSTNLKSVEEFGISPNNIFPMWDWVGGRYSLWSAVGLTISLSVGFNNFSAFLEGAFQMDTHFKSASFNKNIPVVLAMLSIWYNNFFKSETEVLLPYSQYLALLPMYLQQTVMESNGKSVDRNGHSVNYQTGNIVWGSTGTNAQHAFMQLVHQGTKLIPADFIGFSEPLYANADHHSKLMANFYGQTEALCKGKSIDEVNNELAQKSSEIKNLSPFKTFEGNKPSNALLIQKLTPNALGKLIALYEHKTFVQGVVWNIYSYDQFGVELGKELAKNHLKK
ncbi:MAG: glucose-6-phosphate isomerase [Flavobacteriaceae bacterium]|nr:glucose-6-phosphate isomerase [Flavobacteriaceae bacterium]